MKEQQINVLFIADIVGKPGMEALKAHIANVKEKYRIDFCIANGENGAGGKGLTEEIAHEYYTVGIDVITGGNHIFDKHKIFKFLDQNPRVLRPLNYPPSNHGKGSLVATLHSGTKIGVINAQGRTFMYPIDCPFRTVAEEVQRIKLVTPVIVLDFHAEATAEKIAIGHYLNGRVSAVIGTHTHVQTADEKILDGGTAYITDVGMTGAIDSVIGLDRDVAIKRFIKQTPMRYQTGGSDTRFSAVVVSIDTVSGKANRIERIY
ncbi:MAG: TIGR00282 family metallophosphoesterase, partial [candidate division KSB1 bacterium]|nr:TIGR00282 family metallophosphoesterase [candidate division KSB1 bacterium]